MSSYLEVNNISKSYGPRVLFDHISFHIDEGDKIALVAPNGTGKTSLLSIIAGRDSSDGDGSVHFLKDISVAFLEQDQHYDPDRSISDIVLEGAGEKSHEVQDYEVASILSRLRLEDPSRKAGTLSGGEAKRTAIAAALIRRPDFLVLDEPTNHLDVDSIEFLEDYLTRSRCTLLMVTHDRYFLDRVCNQILELDGGKLYRYQGNYSYFLEKREERIANFNAATDRARNLLRTELDWMRRMPCARGTKAKYRIDAFHELKDRAGQRIEERQMEIRAGMARLGRKIINCRGVGYSWGDLKVLEDFTYNFAPGEKIAVVGPNGVGKSTFLDLLAGVLEPSEGEIDRGETLRIGYYRQEGIRLDGSKTVFETVSEIADVVSIGKGETVSAMTFLNYFLFPPSMHRNRVALLSGGERRRLYLLTVLMRSPNFLILDEPTNDLDLMTLNVLEEYLSGFAGSLLIVSHDRFFVDKLADHLFIFEGGGRVKDFVGSYSGYRQYLKDREEERRVESRENRKETRAAASASSDRGERKRRLTYKEKMEKEQLERDLSSLGEEKKSLEERLCSGTMSAQELTDGSVRLGEVNRLIDEKELRWLELDEIEVS
ncbi:MAG TPA: ABC-F family ATP-binding cassette domain-containing protein [Candidatus Coprenecus stercorigallinarum]|nr:ABC-F family ATP-binding cassette domain-containing protein [Candidatus Coprenecus stercorigallinarum]